MHAADVVPCTRIAHPGPTRSGTVTVGTRSDEFVEVVLRVPAELGARVASVAGDFTAWIPVPMIADGAGAFQLKVRLLPGLTYSYRFLLDDTTWINDLAAAGDGTGPNGTPTSIIET